MEKLFKSKIAFVVFVIGFTSLLLIVYKAPAARVINSLAMGALTGFVFAQWYWKAKMDKIQHLIDARMMSPTTELLFKDKEDELFKKANENTKLVDRIGELQNEIILLKESNKDLLAEREYIQTTSKEIRERLYGQESKEKGE
jgi:hypothetical protein